MRRIEVNKGDEYGDLKIVREVKSSAGKRQFLCKCSCDAKVDVRLDHLRSGHTSSCGRCGILYRGERKTLAEWAKKYRVNPSTLRARLKVGMDMREALERVVYR